MTPTVLVVEDIPAHLALACKLLESAGHEVLQARTGGEGVDVALQRRPDLVLMDLGLPDIDGWEALRRIRSGQQSPIKVVAFTAHAMRGDRERVLAAGFDGYLSKPVDYASFAREVETLLP